MTNHQKTDAYLGFETVSVDADGLTDVYEHIHENPFGCLVNEYLILTDENGTLIETWRWTGSKMVKAPYKAINSRFVGRIKPRNVQQQIAIDMLYNDEITVKMMTGCYGSGKDMLMSAVATDMLEKGKIEKIVYVRNNIEVKDSKPIGYLPGTGNEKLMPYAMVLADKLGGQDALEMMMMQGKIEIAHLGFLRGRDLKNSIVYCSEAENLTKEHVQLLLGRIGEGSSLWINGDARQTDLDVFRRNSGMKIALDRLKGNRRFGYVKLLKTERSETAAMADLLD